MNLAIAFAPILAMAAAYSVVRWLMGESREVAKVAAIAAGASSVVPCILCFIVLDVCWRSV